jgi:DNA-binding LytR/AlgR family response regulator
MTLTAPTSLTALIAEDEPLLAQSLAMELAKRWPELHIAATVGDGLSAVSQTLDLQPTVCFLDIRMPGMTGLEAAQALAEDWPADGAPFPLLVFVTAYDQYALQAFEAQAVDYLVKPVDAQRLAASVARLQQRLAERAQRAPEPVVLPQTLEQLRALIAGTARAQPKLTVIQASIGHVIHLVPVDEVLYFEAADKYVRVVTAEKEYLIRLSLRELLPQLDEQRFWQVHRGTVVQARAVQTALREESGRVVLTLRGRDDKLVVSRLYAHLFKGM